MRRCVFCGDAWASRGPALPGWVRDCFPGDELAPVFPRKLVLACRGCRNDWLAELEEDAAPALRGLMAGRPRVLTQQDQELLALWAAKTILTLQAARDPDTFCAELYNDVFER